MIPYLTQPVLWRRIWTALTERWSGAPAPLVQERRYRYVKGMEHPDDRFAPIPGAVARAREEQVRRTLGIKDTPPWQHDE
jgi:hypothetical protein